MIRVTRKDIAEGVSADVTACPVFLAVNRQLELVDQYNVWNADYDEVDLNDKIRTPGVVKRFMQRFDEGKKVKPFSFRLNFNGWARLKLKPHAKGAQ